MDRPVQVYERERFELTRKAPLEDPETFLKRLQTGQKASIGQAKEQGL